MKKVGKVTKILKRNSKFLSFIVGFSVVGLVSVSLTRAATLNYSIEPEGASVSGNASIVSNASASSGQAVKFGTQPTEPGECAVTTLHVPDGPDGMGGCWPGPSNTGVPNGVNLTAYSGSCNLNTPNTIIDSKLINCNLQILASNITIKNSRINGRVINNSTNNSFTIIDSEVIGPQGANPNDDYTGVSEYNFTLLRVEVTGGNRSVYCHNTCDVRDSFTHGQNIVQNVRVHASGFRQSQNGVVVHNVLTCDVQDTPSGGGCSASLTGYGDFEPVKNNLIEKNLFAATTGGACAYGGSSGDDGSKPYGHLAENIRFIDNIFQKRSSVQNSGKCGYYFPITDFDSSRPGNVWSNNRWDDGGVVPPAN